jgi:class 3 adenylate cyclase/tetratricopeptide (TPR) repeat protein
MTCPRCQAENPPGTRFCGQCAAPLASVCPSCGASNPPENKFCGQCAAPLDKSAQPRFAAPESYTPRHLAEKILTSKAALEGERKQVTVLFADLKGSMELLADRDPEEARKILDPVLEHMMEAVHRYEGTVNQVMGDGIMALFGAPLAHEDHAVRACYAALRMQESVEKYAEEVRRAHAAVIKIRVGLNSGEVVVRAIGSDLHMDYTAVGQTTHLAARMEQLADPGAILLGPTTAQLAGAHVDLKPRGLSAVKGLTEPVEVYELRGAVPVRSRFQIAIARGLSRFAGREAELDQLREATAQAEAGHGQVVAVVGDPGIGKSRLLHEFAWSHPLATWSIIESGTVSHGKTTAYLPVIGLLKGYFAIGDEDSEEVRREKINRKVASFDGPLESYVPAFLSLLDVPAENPEWQRLDPPERRQRTLEGIQHLLLEESRVRPLLVLVEDLHWMDTETQAVLDGLVESLATERLLLLVDYRPEYQNTWGTFAYHRQLRIGPLSAERTAEHVDSFLGTHASLAPLKQMLIARTEGNPLFLEESVRALVETQALIGERGAYHLARDAGAIEVPATVQAVLAARIDRLAPEDKRLLQTAAVVGKDVPWNLLVAVGELRDEDLYEGVARLRAAEFLYEARLFPDLEVTFKHALTHEVAYGSLLRDRRRVLHARVMAAIEQEHADRLSEHIDQLAHHAVRGELWDRAVSYSRQAGARAMDRSAFPQAVAQLDQALEALGHLPDGQPRTELEIDVRIQLFSALVPLDQFERPVTLVRDALPLAEALGDERRLQEVLSAIQFTLLSSGDAVNAIVFGERALALAQRRGDRVAEARVLPGLGYAFNNLGDLRRAKEILEKAVQLLDGDLLYERFGRPWLLSVFSRLQLTFVLCSLGEFAEALPVAERTLRVAESVDQPFTLQQGLQAAAHVPLEQGDGQKAIPILERLVALPTAHNHIYRISLSQAYARCGRLAEAAALVDRIAASSATPSVLAHRPVMIGETELLIGRLEGARTWATLGLDLALKQRHRGAEARALRLLGEIAAHPDAFNAEMAESHYSRGLALASEIGMRPLIAHCHAGLGRLYQRTGKRSQAREHFPTATTMYREMGMMYWLEKLEAELAEFV